MPGGGGHTEGERESPGLADVRAGNPCCRTCPWAVFMPSGALGPRGNTGATRCQPQSPKQALTQTTGSHHIRGTRELQAARSKPPKPLDPSRLGCPIWAWPPHPHCQPHQPVPSSFLTAPALRECPPPTSVCTCSQAAVGRGERRVEALTAPPHLLPAVSRPGGSPSQRGKGALTQTGPHSGGLHVSSP